jgi:hypothetical protein
MDAFTRTLEADQFVGFVRLLGLDVLTVPSAPGIYVVIRASDGEPSFLNDNAGGRFKSRNPTVPVSTLAGKWIDGCSALYVGKATSLRKRLRQYRDFGAGKPVAHWGGRYIWQLADAHELIVCWKPTMDNPRDEERKLLAAFEARYGRLPFANVVR